MMIVAQQVTLTGIYSVQGTIIRARQGVEQRIRKITNNPFATVPF
jgi:hypothetical protein